MDKQGTREIRIYLCAASIDMAEERSALRDRVLPRLLDRLAVPGLRVSFVDSEGLPGGARDLAARCRAIDACRPFFVGLFGERDGGEPAPIDGELLAAHRWMHTLAALSSLEVETTYALTQGDGARQSLFYLRDPAFINELALPLRAVFLPASDLEARRMAAFKESIRRSRRPLLDGYPCRWDSGRRLAGLEPLVERLVADLERAIRSELGPAVEGEPVARQPEPVAAPAAAPAAPSIGPAPRPPRTAPALAAPSRSSAAPPADPDGLSVRGDPAAPSRFVPAAPNPARACEAATTPAMPLHEDVQFTVYRPRAVAPLSWETLLAFAHLSDLPVDAEPGEPDPIEEVKRRSRQLLGDRAARYVDVKQDSAFAIPHQAEITFLPFVPGFDFNPPRCTFLWFESIQQEAFRMRAHAHLEGRMAHGRFSIFWGSLLLAEIQLNILVDSQVAARAGGPQVAAAAQPFGKVFASYSHKDALVVEEIERAARTLGHRYLRDVTDLRAGEDWSDRLETMIQEADIFQLFWSRNAMRSPYVEREWRFALALGRRGFVRPTYWEDPLPTDPQCGLPPPDLERLHFDRFYRGETWQGQVVPDLDAPALRSDPPAPAPGQRRPLTDTPGWPTAAPPLRAGQVAAPHAAALPAPEAYRACSGPLTAAGAAPRAARRSRWLVAAGLFAGCIGLSLFVQMRMGDLQAGRSPAPNRQVLSEVLKERSGSNAELQKLLVALDRMKGEIDQAYEEWERLGTRALQDEPVLAAQRAAKAHDILRRSDELEKAANDLLARPRLREVVGAPLKLDELARFAREMREKVTAR
jgi:uncharacterized protein YukE